MIRKENVLVDPRHLEAALVWRHAQKHDQCIIEAHRVRAVGRNNQQKSDPERLRKLRLVTNYSPPRPSLSQLVKVVCRRPAYSAVFSFHLP